MGEWGPELRAVTHQWCQNVAWHWDHLAGDRVDYGRLRRGGGGGDCVTWHRCALIGTGSSVVLKAGLMYCQHTHILNGHTQTHTDKMTQMQCTISRTQNTRPPKRPTRPHSSNCNNGNGLTYRNESLWTGDSSSHTVGLHRLRPWHVSQGIKWSVNNAPPQLCQCVAR